MYYIKAWAIANRFAVEEMESMALGRVTEQFKAPYGFLGVRIKRKQVILNVLDYAFRQLGGRIYPHVDRADNVPDLFGYMAGIAAWNKDSLVLMGRDKFVRLVAESPEFAVLIVKRLRGAEEPPDALVGNDDQ